MTRILPHRKYSASIWWRTGWRVWDGEGIAMAGIQATGRLHLLSVSELLAAREGDHTDGGGLLLRVRHSSASRGQDPRGAAPPRRHLSVSLADPQRPADVEHGDVDRTRSARHARSHDGAWPCRATFSTWANETGAGRPDVIEACLAHEETNRVRAGYNRSKFNDERRTLLEAWATFLAQPAACSVVPLRAA